MSVEVIGIDHVYLSVSDMNASEWFYDTVMLQVLGYRKGESVIAGDAHVHYYNRQFGFSLRPARTGVIHEITNFWQDRRERMERWEPSTSEAP
jgi:glyoxylase I family protein